MKTAAPEMVTRYQGNCQLCEGDFRLTAERTMVHHGFKRPGIGEIVGDCSGVGHEPYELSCYLVKVALRETEAQLANEEQFLVRLRAGEIRTLYVEERRYKNGRFETEVIELRAGVTPEREWTQTVERRIASTEYGIKRLKHRIEHLTKRIADWTLQPVVEFDEAKIEAEKQAVRDARKADRDAIKAEKKAHKDALQARRDEREASRVALIRDFAAKFTALAEDPDTAETRKVVYKLCEELGKKKAHKFGYWHAYEMKCDDALVKLGLATADKTSHAYRYHFQVGR